jgi:hypothetical protein
MKMLLSCEIFNEILFLPSFYVCVKIKLLCYALLYYFRRLKKSARKPNVCLTNGFVKTKNDAFQTTFLATKFVEIERTIFVRQILSSFAFTRRSLAALPTIVSPQECIVHLPTPAMKEIPIVL